MEKPEPEPSGDLQPPRKPPRVATATSEKDRPQFTSFAPPKQRLFAWTLFLVLFAIIVTLVALFATGFWKRPIAAMSAIIVAIYLFRRSVGNETSAKGEPSRKMFYGTLLAGIVGEFLGEVLLNDPVAGPGWRVLNSITFGLLIGLATYWTASLLVPMANLLAAILDRSP